MANENSQNAALSEGIAFMEKCLDTMLAEQRKAAHNAIDMDDWNKAEEILAATKKNIVRIEGLKNKFAEFKAEAVKLEFLSGEQPEPKPAEQPKPEQQPKPEPKPEQQPKPDPKPAEQPKPEPKPAEQPKSSPGSEAKNEILDMEMTDFDPDPKAKDPIIEACESLITKFPFSMRLIYSNSKIGKFFTADEVIAENDMSKPKQLSNGLWVETNIPEEKVQTFIRGVTRYCEESVNM